MKKVYVALLAMLPLLAVAQSGINYQAVARNSSGNPLVNQNVGVSLTITDALSGGSTLYNETHNVTTNQFGLFSLVIGSGTPVTGTFGAIDWTSTDRFLNVQVDPAGGTSYIDMGTSQLLSVPYAKNAEKIGLYNSGTANPTRTIVQHSPAYPQYGLFYADLTDQFQFNGISQGVLTVAVDHNQVGINTTTIDPNARLHVEGNVRVKNGAEFVQATPTEINQTQTGTANLIPICYGSVAANGTINVNGSATNFTVTKTGTGSYEVSITGVNYFFSSFTTIASINSSSSIGFIGTNSANNNLVVRTYDTGGVAIDRPFNFVVYRP